MPFITVSTGSLIQFLNRTIPQKPLNLLAFFDMSQLSRSDIYDRPFAELLPSEKAAVMKALYDPKQCGSDQTEDWFGRYAGRSRSRKELAERFGYSSRNVARYLRINDLIQPLKDLVDGNKISLVAAVELSYLPVGEQWIVYNVISKKGLKLTASFASFSYVHF